MITHDYGLMASKAAERLDSTLGSIKIEEDTVTLVFETSKGSVCSVFQMDQGFLSLDKSIVEEILEDRIYLSLLNYLKE